VLYFKYLRPFEVRWSEKALAPLRRRSRSKQKSVNFKAALKTVFKAASAALSAHEMKELESVLIAARNARAKEEKEAQLKAAKKATAKGKPALSKASLDGDLDDVRFGALDSGRGDEDYDFM